ncbi:MAG TPA: hypothetical protein VGF75_06570 [Candidatus Saccharimonadales bacterium]
MSKSFNTLRKSLPVKGVLIAAGSVGLMFAVEARIQSDGQSVDPAPAAHVTTPKPRSQEQIGPRVPELKANNVGAMAVALEHLNLGWGESQDKFAGNKALAGIVTLPDGEQVETTIYTLNSVPKGAKSVKANDVVGVSMSVYGAGHNYLSSPDQTDETYWFAPSPLQDIGLLGNALYHYDAGVSYGQSTHWMDAYENGVVDTSTQTLPNSYLIGHLDQTYGDRNSANSTVREIEKRALTTAAYAGAGDNLLQETPIEPPKQLDPTITIGQLEELVA